MLGVGLKPFVVIPSSTVLTIKQIDSDSASWIKTQQISTPQGGLSFHSVWRSCKSTLFGWCTGAVLWFVMWQQWRKQSTFIPPLCSVHTPWKAFGLGFVGMIVSGLMSFCAKLEALAAYVTAVRLSVPVSSRFDTTQCSSAEVKRPLQSRFLLFWTLPQGERGLSHGV